LPREFWPPERLLPTDDVLPWIMDQHNHGVWVLLCLEHEVEAEPELPMDFGIYGQSAVGVQSLDRSCRTLEFKLQFGGEAIRLAEDRWNRLKLHTTQLRTLLDSPSQDA